MEYRMKIWSMRTTSKSEYVEVIICSEDSNAENDPSVSNSRTVMEPPCDAVL